LECDGPAGHSDFNAPTNKRGAPRIPVVAGRRSVRVVAIRLKEILESGTLIRASGFTYADLAFGGLGYGFGDGNHFG
jgi:hypothetical protein